jgi:carboxyl-terminal processing protease
MPKRPLQPIRTKRRLSLKRSLVLFAGCALLFTAARPNERYFEIAKNLDIFATLFKEINTYYVDEVNPGTLMENAIEKMLEGLDPYTNYIPEDQMEDFRTITTGQYAGVGAIIGRRNNRSTVLMCYEGYPAQKAGLLIGDELVEIDGIDILKKNAAEVTKLLKGQADTKIKVKIKRYGKVELLAVEMKREHIKISNVPYSGMIGSDVGYIQLKDFNMEAGRDVKKAMVELKEKGATSIMLDVRENPGGLLNEAINICNLFLPKDLDVVSTKGKVSEWNKQYRSLSPPVDTAIPVVVLINGYSASASEIVSGVLQDYDRAVLVGQRTYGKGLVQTTRPLSYNSSVKITTAKYYIPSGRCIQAIDYTNRSAEGAALKIADSLRRAFKTARGRPVFDGGGITPDIDIDIPQATPIAQSLSAKGLLFDYATEYRNKHATLASASAFSLSETEYETFTKWLNGKEYDYTTKVEISLKELEDFAKKENYYSDIHEQIDLVRKKMSHNRVADLEKNKTEIREMLEQEIVSRYYMERGIKEASFDNDVQVQAALGVLRNRAQYKKMLGQ